MAWSYPEISLQDLIIFIKNFIDMLILASGYQSTGRLAHWDCHNIKKSFQWALFIENVVKGLTSSVDYEDSLKELDAALSELKSHPRFPQGLAQLSCSTLVRARDLLLEHLIQTLPLRESHLRAVMSASVEMDFSKLRIDNDCLDVHFHKLMRIPSKDLSESRNLLDSSMNSSFDAVPSEKNDNRVDGDFSVTAIEQIGKRQHAVACSSAAETGLENLRKTIGQSMHDEFGNTSNTRQINHLAFPVTEELPVEPIVWNCWKSRSLSYMLNKRTLRLVSGASMICSAPRAQWVQMFEQLNVSAESDDLCEAIEVLLLGCIADRWNVLIEHLMSVSNESPPISRLYHEVFNLSLGKSLNLFQKEGFMNHKEKSVVEYLEVLLSSQPNQLWKLSPVLVAIAIPSCCSDPTSVSWRVNSEKILWQSGAAIVQLMQRLIGSARWLREYGVFIYFIYPDPIPHGERLLLHDCAGHLL